MGQERRSFGSIERRSGYFRARYVGPDRQRYEAPHLFSDRIDAEFWLGEVHRSISRQEWRPPVKVKGQPDDLDTLAEGGTDDAGPARRGDARPAAQG